MAVCACVVGGGGSGGRGGVTTFVAFAGCLTDICILHTARNLTDICVYNKTIRNADDVEGKSARRFDADLCVGGKEGGWPTKTPRQRHVAAAWARGIRRGKRQIKENSAHIKSQSQSPKKLESRQGSGEGEAGNGWEGKATRGA